MHALTSRQNVVHKSIILAVHYVEGEVLTPLQHAAGLVTNADNLGVNALLLLIQPGSNGFDDVGVAGSTEATVRGDGHNEVVGLGMVLLHIKLVEKGWEGTRKAINPWVPGQTAVATELLLPYPWMKA